MAWKSLLPCFLALGAAGALQNGLTIRELQRFKERAATLERRYAPTFGAQPGDVVVKDTDPSLLYPAYNLSVPLDHFHNESIYEPHSNATFNLRYWFDATYYQKGGPVIVLQGGEISATERLPFLQKGIINILSRATGGLGVILEHRYYGTSVPVSDYSTENLRFLTTEQGMADMAYFAQHVQFKGLEDQNLTSQNVPYIAYGGSYAGGLVALLRKAYPDVFWGAIASSATIQAIYDYWAYWEAARIYAPGDCAINTAKVTDIVDKILIGKNGTDYVQKIKNVFGLGNLTRNDDFANTATGGGIGGLQFTNWDPALNEARFMDYCNIVTNSSVLYSETEAKRNEVVDLLNVTGYAGEIDTLSNPVLNYIGYLNATRVHYCDGYPQDDCFSNYAYDYYQQYDITQDWRPWTYQYCMEWGYLQTGSAPKDQLPLVSRLVDVRFVSVVCQAAFNMTGPSQVERINKWGGFNLSYPRLALITGERDPWRQTTAHAFGLPERQSTTDEPFYLIPGAVHHWDENGFFPNETTEALPPPSVKDIQAKEAAFVKAWVEEWKQAKSMAG